MITFLPKKPALRLAIFIGIIRVAFFLGRPALGDPIEVMLVERRLDPDAHARLA